MREDLLHVLKKVHHHAAKCASFSLHVKQHRIKNRYCAAKRVLINTEGDVCDLYSGGKLPMRHRKQGYEYKGFWAHVGVLERYWRAISASRVAHPLCNLPGPARMPWLDKSLTLDLLILQARQLP